MADKKNIHTVQTEKGWVNKPEGGQALGPVHRTQRRAVEVGQQEARNRGGEHLTHGVDGKIRARNSYGKESLPAEGLRNNGRDLEGPWQNATRP